MDLLYNLLILNFNEIMITIAEDNFLGTLTIQTPSWLKNFCQIDLIEDFGDLSPDEDAYWAVCVNGDWYTGDRPKVDKNYIPTNPPSWATHIIWNEA